MAISWARIAWMVCLLPAAALSQPTNDSLVSRLKQLYAAPKTDTLAQPPVFTPTVSYQKTGPGLWARTVTLGVSQGLASEQFQTADTLTARQLRDVRRRSSPPFRGEWPGTGSKTLLPALGLAAGTAGVVLLFYLRSR